MKKSNGKPSNSKAPRVPTIRGTLILLISALHEAAEKVRTRDLVKYATLKAYQDGLTRRLTSTKGSL